MKHFFLWAIFFCSFVLAKHDGEIVERFHGLFPRLEKPRIIEVRLTDNEQPTGTAGVTSEDPATHAHSLGTASNCGLKTDSLDYTGAVTADKIEADLKKLGAGENTIVLVYTHGGRIPRILLPPLPPFRDTPFYFPGSYTVGARRDQFMDGNDLVDRIGRAIPGGRVWLGTCHSGACISSTCHGSECRASESAMGWLEGWNKLISLQCDSAGGTMCTLEFSRQKP